MADLSIVAAGIREDGESDPADVPVQRSDAGADQRTGGGLFCKSVRHHVSGPATQRSRVTGAGSIALDAGGPGCAHPGVHFPWFVSDTFPFAVRSGDSSIVGSAARFGVESG